MEGGIINKERRIVLALLGFFLFLLFLEFPGSHLFDPDEARYAEIPREMLASHDFLALRLNGSSYYEKPPLLYWANAASIKIFGENSYSARLVVRLSCLATVVLVLFSEGLWAGLIYISSLLPFALGRINITDGLLSFFMTATFLSLRAFIRERDQGQSGRTQAIMLGLSAAMAMLTKGLIAIVIPGLVLLPWAIITGRSRRLFDVLYSWAPFVFILVTVPAFMLIETANPGFTYFFIIHEHFQRYSTNEAQRSGPIYYFVPVFILGLMPWTIYFFKSLKERWGDSDSLYLILWSLVPVVFFSVSHSKLIPYILPVFPAAAILIARWISSEKITTDAATPRHSAIFLAVIAMIGLIVASRARVIIQLGLMPWVGVLAAFILVGSAAAYYFSKSQPSRAPFALAVAWSGAVFTLVAAVPKLAIDYSDHNVAAAALGYKQLPVVAYDTYSQSFPWVLKHPIVMVDFTGELASNNIESPELFWNEVKFRQSWLSDNPMLCVIAAHNKNLFMKEINKNGHPISVLAENHRSVLLANFDIRNGGHI